MSATIGEPVVVASFDVPSSSRPTRHYIASTAVERPAADAELTLTVHAHSIHTLELPSLHPVLSHTFPPSTSFPAPAVSRRRKQENGDQLLETYIATAQPTSKSSSVNKYHISRWEYTSSSPDHLPRQIATAELPFEIDSIFNSDALPSHIIATSPRGQLLVFDNSLTITSQHESPQSNSTRLTSYLVPRDICTFSLPPIQHQQNAILINVSWATERVFFNIYSIAAHTGQAELVGDVVLNTPTQPLHASVDPSGYVSLLFPTGVWTSCQLDWSSQSGFSLAINSNLSLSLPCFQTSTPQPHLSSQLSLLAIGDSRVLLSAIVPSNPNDVLLLLWDLRYSVVLATTTCPVPPSVAMHSSEELDISLSRIGADQVCITLSPRVSGKSRSARCVALVASFSTPPTSTIAVAMRCLEETKSWIGGERDVAVLDTAETTRRTLVADVAKWLLAGDVDSANKKFFDWAESVESKSNTDYQENIQFAPIKHRISGKRPSAQASASKKDPKSAIIPFQTAAALLQTFFSVDTYTPSHNKVVKYLLERRLVSQNMVSGGVTNMLVKLNDWESIDWALRTMTDIPESDLIRLLAPLIEKTRLTNSSDPSRMDTEDATADNLPSLQSVLARVLKYPVSPAALGKAIHAQFTDYRDLVCLFEILDGWMSQWVSKGSMVKFEVEVRDVKSIAAFDQTKKAEKKLGIPTLDYIVEFIRILLDASLVSIMQHAALQPILERMRTNLSLYTSSHESLYLLRGFLEPFTRVRELPDDTPPPGTKGPIHIKPKTAHAPPVPLKPYQIEELVF